MKKDARFFVCEHCGNLVTTIEDAGVPMMCCGQKMTELKAGTTDAAVEKHVPVVTQDGNKVSVAVSSVEHPMLPEHYIQFIEIYKKDKSELHLKYLNPGDIAEFNITCLPEEIDAIEFCNIHGLWGENKND